MPHLTHQQPPEIPNPEASQPEIPPSQPQSRPQAEVQSLTPPAHEIQPSLTQLQLSEYQVGLSMPDVQPPVTEVKQTGVQSPQPPSRPAVCEDGKKFVTTATSVSGIKPR